MKLLLKKYINNTLLCIKYPFLYPRNRFTGNHYTNFHINSRLNYINRQYELYLYLNTMTLDKWNSLDNELFNANRDVSVNVPRYETYLSNIIYKGVSLSIKKISDNEYKIFAKRNNITINTVILNIADYIEDISIVKDIMFKLETIRTYHAGNVEKLSLLAILDTDKEIQKISYNHIYVKLRNFIKLEKTLLTYLNNILAIFHIIPSYTELDALDKGWRIKFGLDICNEIKHSLLHTYIRELPDSYSTLDYIKAYLKGIQCLYNYRITQIKEKYGSLRWYDAYSTTDIQNIISKYEYISGQTCIECGKPAEWQTTGWICPYCDEHVPDKNRAIKINNDKHEEGIKA